MLKITQANNNQKPIYLNPAHIYHICPQGTGCYIHMGPATTGMGHCIKESAEEVSRMLDVDEFAGNERADVVFQLRQLCADYGDNDWPDELHLGDVIEKHLARHLYSGEE